MPKGIPKFYTYLIERGAHVIPQIHLTLCSPACVFYADCKNYAQNEPCMGFKLTENGSGTRQILANLNENDRIFVERCLEDIPKLKDEQYKETLVKEVLRYLEPEQSEKPIKKVTRIYDGNLVYSEKTEELKTLEEPEFVQISLFNQNYQIPADNIRKPIKPEEPKPLNIPDPQKTKIREKLEETMKPQKRILESQFPETCTPQCPQARHCAYANTKNYGKPCVKRAELYKNK